MLTLTHNHTMKLQTLTAALLTCTTPLLCQAGRPLQTEDAGILEAKTCEVEGVTARTRVAGASSVRDNALQLGPATGDVGKEDDADVTRVVAGMAAYVAAEQVGGGSH